MDYLSLIQQYLPSDSPAYRIYMIHVTLVTAKALKVARRLKLSQEQLQFIEEASMLHDIGICQVDAPDIFCHGEHPYIAHVSKGAEILRSHGLELHAQVVETHTGVGMRGQDLKAREVPLPARDYIPQSIEEEIISWADLFYTKVPDKIWQEKSLDQVRTDIARFGPWYKERLETMIAKFQPLES